MQNQKHLVHYQTQKNPNSTKVPVFADEIFAVS